MSEVKKFYDSDMKLYAQPLKRLKQIYFTIVSRKYKCIRDSKANTTDARLVKHGVKTINIGTNQERWNETDKKKKEKKKKKKKNAPRGKKYRKY